MSNASKSFFRLAAFYGLLETYIVPAQQPADLLTGQRHFIVVLGQVNLGAPLGAAWVDA